MDEILIEEKKYISSKRAAEITGYAKDYIGQLCREGRVPARLVGRSWYVLEAAIQDHRFGSVADEPVKPVKASEEPSLQSTWEAPRYEASSAELLPSINRLSELQTPAPDEAPQRLQDSWQAWFNRMADHTEPIVPATLENQEQEPVPVPESEPEPEPELEKEEDEEVNIPIHAIYQPMIQEPLPRITKDTEEERAYEQPQYKPARQGRREGNKRIKKGVKTIKIVGILLAAISVVFAVLGSGYFDKYITSDSQVMILAGISTYNK